MLSEREKELLLAVAEATLGVGGHLSLGNQDMPGDPSAEWWQPGLVTPCWTQKVHPDLEAALTEAAERLGCLPEPKRPFIEEEGW